MVRRCLAWCWSKRTNPVNIGSIWIQYQCIIACLQEMNFIMEHYSEVIMSVMPSQITGVKIVYSIVCVEADQRKHQSSTSLAFVRGIHWWPVNSLHKGPVMRKMLSSDNVIMKIKYRPSTYYNGPKLDQTRTDVDSAGPILAQFSWIMACLQGFTSISIH